MVNAWTTVELLGPNRDGEPRRYAIATGASVSQGDLLELLDNRTVQSATDSAPVAGVAAEDHKAEDAVPEITLLTQALFRVIASGGITVGLQVDSGGVDNTVHSGGLSNSWSGMRAFDTVTDTQTLTVRLDV